MGSDPKARWSGDSDRMVSDNAFPCNRGMGGISVPRSELWLASSTDSVLVLVMVASVPMMLPFNASGRVMVHVEFLGCLGLLPPHNCGPTRCGWVSLRHGTGICGYRVGCWW